MLEDSLTQGGGDHNTVVVQQDAIVCVERIADWGEACQCGVLAVYDAIALEDVWRVWASDSSLAVSCAKRDHEMALKP